MKFHKAFKKFTSKKQPNKEQQKLYRLSWTEGTFLCIVYKRGVPYVVLYQNGKEVTWAAYETDLISEDWELMDGK